MNLGDYKENHFKGLDSQILDIDRYRQFRRMMIFLGESRNKYHLRHESYLDGMCEHLSLFHLDKEKNGKIVATLVNDFDKNFYYYEREKPSGKAQER